MRPAELPDRVLSKMKPQDRAKMGVMTLAEANEKFVARNERELQERILNLLRLRSIVYYCPTFGKRSTGRAGWPDITFAVHGRACAFEVKFDKGKLSEEQERTHAQMRQNGWHVHIIRSVQEAKEILDQLVTEKDK